MTELEDEARRLAHALQDWASRQFPAEQAHLHVATGAPECQWCPVCRIISVLRGDHPEVSDRLVEAGTAVLAAVRTLLDAAATAGATAGAAPPTDGPVAQPPQSEQAGDPVTRPGRVHRIDLSGGGAA